MKQIQPGAFPVLTHEWDCSDAGETYNLFEGLCKGIIFKSVPNAVQYFTIRLMEEDGRSQQWRIQPCYQGQRLIFDHPVMIQIDTGFKVALLVSYRTVLIIMDDIITEIDAHDPAEMIWDPLIRDVVIPADGSASVPVYYYPLRSGFFRIRANCVGLNAGYHIRSHCESLNDPYHIIGSPKTIPATGETWGLRQMVCTNSAFGAYLTQGVRYEILFTQDEQAVEDGIVKADVTTVHGSFPV